MRRYISDLHFFHKNMVFKMDNRPFKTVEDMNDYMIKQWNSVVGKNDETVIIGDFSFGDGKQTNEILKLLNGKKHLVRGNHDRYFLKDKNFDVDLLGWVDDYKEMNDNNRKVVLSHYPNIFYNGQYRKDENGVSTTYMLHGHIHNTQDTALLNKMIEMGKNFTYIDRNGEIAKIPFNIINCFCMFSDYVPLTLDEWIEKQG